MFRVLLAGLLAAGLAMAANMVLKRAGRAGVAYYGPLLEECLKTGWALILNVSVPGVHIFFGIFEALGDCLWGGRFKKLAALSAVTAHTAFGLITYYAISRGYPVLTSVLAAAGFHMLWNVGVLKISESRKTSAK